MAPSPFSPKATSLLLLLLLCAGIAAPAAAQPLASSQVKALLRVRRLLGYPPALEPLRWAADPCALPPTPILAVACEGGQVTALSVRGDRAPDAAWRAALPATFSSEALFTTLAGRLPALARLSLVGLGAWGPIPGGKLRRLQALQQLNLSSNYFYGGVPGDLARLYSLQSLVLSWNWLNGSVPSLAGLQFLEELDLSHNRLGPAAFPEVGKAVARLVLADNNFTGKIPAGVSALGQLQYLDASGNRLQGWIPSSIFALPALRYINLSRNRLTGQLPATTPCAEALAFVDVSANLLTGPRPACMRGNSSARTVLVAGNCFADAKQQRATSYCSPGALAAVLPPPQGNGDGGQGKGKGGEIGMILAIAGSVVGGALLIALVMVVVTRRARRRNPEVSVLPKSPAATPAKKADGWKAPAKATQKIITPADKRHASQAARVNTLEVPAYREYTLEELQEATNNFSSSNLIKTSPLAQHYNGQLQDGSRVLVRCLRLKPKYSSQSLVQYMEIISKLRHRHLVCIIGHCIVSDPENPNIASSVYLISECVANGSLRSHLTEWRKREMLKWPQRVSAAIGVARGIQFLHNVTAPGIIKNDLNIENILLDKTLTSKINDFNLPMISTSKNGKIFSEIPFAVHEDNDIGSAHNMEQGDKQDIYQFGLILLEVITGKPTDSQSELEPLKAQLSEALTEDPERLKDMADPAIQGTFAVDSLSTVAEIALNCTAGDPSDRPSIDDVIWNLQYSMQVQDGWASSESLGLSVKSQA
ncbi:putative LRR receptor-like serine/threonine-protein kinase [Dichanthelium oligosanthes]|uniref:Putative LRR receptor-like serine/threonine-protein kinase n=1 Tax=Dichanthelium oligosanthes TaxID=888268 RepID=A0A1E5VYR2_9POAL|nr:putative LRR receptor-like serine/threonine-protein kinase [Dichanthelium oligosanthes]